MLLLALDTATERASLALAAEDWVLGEDTLTASGSYLKLLLPALETLLARTGCALSQVGGLAVSQGPGNFTGLRIGLATAQGLAFALNLPVVAVSTLEILAAEFAGQAQPVAAIIDAKRQEVYLGRYQSVGGVPQALHEPRRLPVAALPGELAPPLLLTGPGLTAYEAFLTQALHPEIRLAPPERRHPRAATLARLARQRLQAGKTAAPQRLTPAYLRPAL